MRRSGARGRPGHRRRWAAALGVGALVVAGGGVLAGPAQATVTASVPVDFPTHCIPPAIAGIPPIDGTTKASITVDNAAPKVGETVTVTYTVVEAAAGNPVDLALPADIMTPTGKVTVGGAQSASVTVAGPKKNDPVPGKGTFPSFSMTGTFTVTAPGSITLSPGDYNIHTSYIMELDTPCTVTDPPAPVSETIIATDDGAADGQGTEDVVDRQVETQRRQGQGPVVLPDAEAVVHVDDRVEGAEQGTVQQLLGVSGEQQEDHEVAERGQC
ncbi:hypothetical protein ACFVZJ_15875, partial [Streptomyces sp. NPDC058322]